MFFQLRCYDLIAYIYMQDKARDCFLINYVPLTLLIREWRKGTQIAKINSKLRVTNKSYKEIDKQKVTWRSFLLPPSLRMTKLSFWSQKNAQCSETCAKTIFRFFAQNFNFKFLRRRFFNEKCSFAPISFKLGSAFLWEDSKKMKK